jgi:hypothetical protein
MFFLFCITLFINNLFNKLNIYYYNDNYKNNYNNNYNNYEFHSYVYLTEMKIKI